MLNNLFNSVCFQVYFLVICNGYTRHRKEDGGGLLSASVIRIIAIHNHTNWLMPMGARECNLKIQDNSVRLRLEVLAASDLGVHHSNTENCICLWLCPSLLK